MIPQPITIGGKTGTVVYLDAQWHPVPAEKAAAARVLFDDGSTAFFTAQAPAQKREYVRDEQGQFAETGKQRQGDEEEAAEKARTLFHGTTDVRLADILKQGLLTGHSGEVWPGFSQRDSVYMTTNEEDAQEWAIKAAERTESFQNTPAPAVAILTIRIPDEYLRVLIPDQHFAKDNPWTPARQFQGNIPPSWIVGAKVGHLAEDARTFEDFTWKDVPLPKKAADGQIVYVVVVLHSSAKAPGVGGITRKFDESKHPRGEDGRFIEASQPRIFSRYEDVGQYDSWGEKKWGWRATAEDVRFGAKLGEVTGKLLTGEPIPRDQIPAKLYHVTTNAPAVEESGVLLGLREHGGLGGGQAEGVSFTSSKEDAHVIQRELRRAVQIARGDVSIEDLTRWAREDEKEAGLPEGSLDKALTYALEGYEGNKFTLDKTFVWDKNLPEEQRGWQSTPPPPEERERIRRSLVKDALNAYLQSREEAAARALGQQEWPWSVPILKNPILFGQQEHLAKLKPENIQILETAAEDIPADALVTTGSDKFLHEVRVYADVPRKRVKKYDPNQARHPEGTTEGGRFAETGRSGVPTSDPLLAVQAKAGIAAVEKLIPEAVKTADFDPGSTGVMWDTVDQATKDSVYWAYVKAEAGNIQAGDEDMDDLDAEWQAEENWETLSDQDKSNVMNDYAIMGKLPARRELEKTPPEHWVSGIEKGSHNEADYARTHAVTKRLTELRMDELRKERGLLEKAAYTIKDTSVAHGTPSFVVLDAEGNRVGGGRTLELATASAEQWATQHISSENVIHAVWSEWLHSSSGPLSLSLQLAAARELGGHHRMTPEEVVDAEADAEPQGGIATLQAYVRAQWEVTQTVLQKAGEDKISVYRGLQLPGAQVNGTTNLLLKSSGEPADPPTNVKEIIDPNTKEPHVGFDFNGEHFVVRKNRESPKSILDIKPGVGSPYESTESAIQRRLAAYANSSQSGLTVKLPDLQLQRAGAQSTTGTIDVANDWGGVGNLPPDPTRVVLRIEAPPTSVLSLPVYGENSQSEHEVVILGTKDKWLWDAWRNRAPSLTDVTITGEPVKKPLVDWGNPVDYDSQQALKAEQKPLVIDLQAEDRGKQHWMSTVDWATVVKWDESEHPRDTAGRFTEGSGTQTAQLDAGAGGSGGVAVPPKAKGRPDAVPEALHVANAYNEAHGFQPMQHGYVAVDEVRAGAIADAYDALPENDLDNPAVREAYAALSTEIQAQWDHILASGMTFTPWTKEGQPYQNSTEMAEDVRTNKHLYFFTGGTPHPLLDVKDASGLSMNDKFRAVHDYFGHAAGGYGFGARGEENAWLSHSQMLTPPARRALTTETRGQNSWVNFGRHNYHPDGTYKHIPPADRPYATQKVALLSDVYVFGTQP